MLQISRRTTRPLGARWTTGALLAFLALLAGVISGCADEPTAPAAPAVPGGEPSAATFGLVEITLTGLGTAEPASYALSAASLAELEALRASRAGLEGGLTSQGLSSPDSAGGNGTIQFELLSTGSFTEGVRGAGGVRYLSATFRVRNAQSDGTPYGTHRDNLTFLAVDTDKTLGQTAISTLALFDGTALKKSTIAEQLLPTGAVIKDQLSDAIESTGPDVLQLLTEAEAGAIDLTGHPQVTDVFPYGFVVRRSGSTTTRELPASPAVEQFDGIVTFAFKVPLQSTPADEPFTISLMFLAVDDGEVRLTQSVEEQTTAGTAAAQAAAAGLGATTLTLLPGGSALLGTGGERVLCEVRVAGPEGGAIATLFPTPGNDAWFVPALVPRRTLPRGARFAVGRCPAIANASDFTVHGFQSGRGSGGYTGVGTPLARAPAPPGDDYFPGEVVEVTLTAPLAGGTPVVLRRRVAAAAGTGTFTSPDTVPAGLEPASVTAADLDADGDLDLAVANSPDDVLILENGGTGTFTAGPVLPAGDGPTSIAAGDLDGDGDLDLAVANGSSNDVSILENGGTGTFTSAGTVSVGALPFSITTGDLDGDGDLDLAVANEGSDDVSILENDGTGAFTAAPTVPAGSGPSAVTAGDVDDDGDLDLAVANFGSNDVTILENDGAGNFTGAGTVSVGQFPFSITAGDLDADGDLDLAVANTLTNNVSILENDGAGTFTVRWMPIPGGTANAVPVGDRPTAVTAADFDGDGDLDLTVVNQLSGDASILENDGTGIFTASAVPVGDGPDWLTTGDLDGDGDLDLAVVHESLNNVSILENQ